MVEKHNKTFYLKSGKTVNSLKSLAKELKSISKDTFEHHVNIAKNDFANWVKHSLNKDELAKRIEKKIDKIELELEILRHLVFEELKTVAVAKKAAVKPKAVVAKKAVVKKVVAKKSSAKKVKSKK